MVLIPPDVRHWHGASPTNSVTHIALQEQAEGSAVNWLEPVTDAQYGSVAKIATGHGQVPAAMIQAAAWNSPAMKVA